MLKGLSRRSGNKYTIISILMIILMMYFFKFAMGGNEATYPQQVNYGMQKYEYRQTISESALKFQRKYGKSFEGHMLLLKRGADAEAPDKVYIFTKWRKYREYELIK